MDCLKNCKYDCKWLELTERRRVMWHESGERRRQSQSRQGHAKVLFSIILTMGSHRYVFRPGEGAVEWGCDRVYISKRRVWLQYTECRGLGEAVVDRGAELRRCRLSRGGDSSLDLSGGSRHEWWQVAVDSSNRYLESKIGRIW